MSNVFIAKTKPREQFIDHAPSEPPSLLELFDAAKGHAPKRTKLPEPPTADSESTSALAFSVLALEVSVRVARVTLPMLR